ncbi:MAG: sigma-54-dependent Fis family transcriptional regulator [Bacteroidetes bacterium]|nr:sigma-54-dependent Fis family transcriptional regulator [Bacteroidota bacterium]
MNIQDIKNRFEIIGNSQLLNIALETAIKVAPTEMSVLINGESGVGKENFSKIIHALSLRKHGPFIAVNCGAIPEGTIDSELFGHEKGAFTGAHETRKGYFETVNTGTIFLDEIGEMPLETQSRLLRILESGEFIKVGASKAQKTDVRVIAATNKDLLELTSKGRFREDLYYRLCTVPIKVPPLRERGGDILMLFRKFSQDFAEKYKVAPIQIDDQAKQVLVNYRWPGNIRQLKNISEQLTVLVEDRNVSAESIFNYLPKEYPNLPMVSNVAADTNLSERDIFYKVLFDLRKDMNDLKQIVFGMIGQNPEIPVEQTEVFNRIMSTDTALQVQSKQPQNFAQTFNMPQPTFQQQPYIIHHPVEEVIEVKEAPKEEILSLEKKELELIKRALEKHRGRRRRAAKELGISERTLYRKIKQYNLEEY